MLPSWDKQEKCEDMVNETLYTFADHYIRLSCVNFGRPCLGSSIKGNDVFPLICNLQWTTERRNKGERERMMPA